ncbi:BON domain-containing protein [Pseudodesulfovibrio sediminis]|uniref:BON domain-containing protein n=1 Tax=Pseudodesulfovibrio sediminis TaxID=2810563 RepID=A0ABM7P920_9BACT|nr:BON domain-containing protein [Pseudodesulfovibrio sediminis]BCS89531.1 hypothetical protein PSDVSF_27730 [Pseudodesulfovibrio sediminis]
MRKILCLFIVLNMLFMASGCTIYNVSMDERSVGDQASDEQITFQIKGKFLEDDSVKYLDFDAASYYGHVYIVGEYESTTQIDRAVQIARSVDGVRDVTRYMLPKRPDDHCGTTDNLEIYARLKEKLISDGDTWSTNVNIKVVQCNVVLLGIVGSKAEINRVIAHAKSVAGVRSVKSYLKAQPR